MFHTIPPTVLERMHTLEQIDARDRQDGTPHARRLRQVPPDTGRFLAILAAGAPAGGVVEIGASAGYSTLWLALACLGANRTITTFEVDEAKVQLARETVAHAGMDSIVTVVHGDVREHLGRVGDIAFCFLDAEKEVYADCYERVVPKLVRGGLLAADNVISHQEALGPLVLRAQSDVRVDAVVVPIGKGVLLCRKSP